MLTQLHDAISVVCPIVGVSSDGRIDFDKSATDEQRKAAQTLISSWNPDKPYLVSIDAFKSHLAQIRYEKEIGGIVIGSQPVSTNRDEMPIWQGMLLDMTLRPGATSSFEYKPRNGSNTTLTAQQVQRVYECFAWYVQACFATERQLIAAIDAGTPLEQVEAMLKSAWPQTQFEWTAPT